MSSLDNDIPTQPQPSRRDILKAVSTIGRYLDTRNDPTARKLEALFGSLNMQLRLEEETENIRDTAVLL